MHAFSNLRINRLRSWHFILPLFVPIAVAACTDGRLTPSQAVEAYLEALVAKDVDAVVSLSCADWETEAIREVDSFEAVAAELDGPFCDDAGEAGPYALVACSGKIVVTYQGEAQELDLAPRRYRVLLDGGEWRMCGYES